MPGTFSYLKSNDTAYTNLDSCDSTSQPPWSTDMTTFTNGEDFIANRREGDDLIQFDSNSVEVRFIRLDLSTPTSGVGVNFLTDAFSWWFYYTAKSEQVLTGSGGVVCRVYSDATPGVNYAEWDLSGEGSSANLFPELIASWNRFIVSGDNPTRTAGTVPTYTAIKHIEIRFNFNSKNTDSGDPDLAMDWWKFGNRYQVTAGTSVSPADFASMQTFDDRGTPISANPNYGLVASQDVFIEMWVGFRVGNGSTSTYFAAENYFIWNRPFSEDAAQDWTVEQAATLRLGTKDVGTDATYAINGCQMVVTEDVIDGATAVRASDLTVVGAAASSTSALLAYATKFFRWNTISIGTSVGPTGGSELIDCDFDDNETIELRDSALDIKNCKFHDPSGTGNIGDIYVAPNSIEGVQVFNCTQGFRFRATMEVTNYVATDNTTDLAVNDGLTITLVNSTFDPDKILQV